MHRSQGRVLQELSDAAEPILEHLMYGEKPSTNIYRIETMEEGEIMAIPKGSQDLVSYLAHVPSRNPANSGW